MLTIKDGNIKRNNSKVVIGYDLGKNFSQISIYFSGSEEPQTVSSVAGTEMYNIPTVLAKRPGVGQWFYGREALKYAQSEGILVDDLLYKATRGEEVIVEDESYDPVALLSLFVKRSLGLLNMYTSPKNLEAFMFTVSDLNPRVVEVLNKVVAHLSLNCEKITYQSHQESFYSYMIHQPHELWDYQTLILDYNDTLTTMRFEVARHTIPEVAFIHQKDMDSITKVDWSEDETRKKQQMQELDERFIDPLKALLSEGDITTVYLLGDGFKEPWMDESLRVVCKNRRVFQGNNLYSKGACYSIMDKLEPSEVAKSHVYLGESKVKSNIGLKALRRGADSYFAILDAGTDWFEAKSDFDIILDEGNELNFVVTSLTGGRVIEKPIVLDGLPSRPRGTTRLRIHIEMSAVNVLEIEIEDLGFGELFKSSGRAWAHSLSI